MPARETRGTSRSQDAAPKTSKRFHNAADLRRSLHTQDESTMIESLTALRNQLSIKEGEIPSLDDERLALVKSWLEISPGAQDIFDVWEKCSIRQLSLTSLIVAVLSSVVALLSAHYTYHSFAHPVIRTLLSPQWTQKLNSYLGGSHTELVLVTLKLYNNTSNFAGGKERRSLLEAFPWDAKFLPKLLYMRRKGKSSEKVDVLVRPDIRTLYILFILSFVDVTTPNSVKAAFLEQRRDNFTSIFKGISQDSYSFIRRALEVCWTGLWTDAKVRRTVKIGLFGENVLAQLVKLYDRAVPEDDEADHILADVVHHFLLAICSRPGTGLCFTDKGWYPRESDDDDASPEDARDDAKQKSKIYNKILANLLKLLKVNEDPRQQELALKILYACPELVGGYWASASFALEPRLSSKWIANVAFFGSVVSLPVPIASFILEGEAKLYKPVPPPLQTILDNIAPSANIKTHLSRGLQSPSALVQHSTALALAKCLVKYEAVVQAFAIVEAALEEEHEGQWAHRRAELAHEIRKRVPDFQVVVGFAQRVDTPAQAMGAQAVKAAMLTESAQRLMWLYYRLLPHLVAEARFDVGKLLQASQDSSVATAEGTSAAIGLDTLRQLHVLRLLKESDQFTWAGKTGSRTYLYTLLKMYCNTRRSSVRSGVATLLRRVFEHDALFQHDPNEVALWLYALPTTRRSDDTHAPDGTPLSDERECVVGFLDACAQKCHSAPYQYIEELQRAAKKDDAMAEDDVTLTADAVKALPSPLLMTVLEQLEGKLPGIAPLDALYMLTFVRKLLLRLACKLPALDILRTLETRLQLAASRQSSLSSSMIFALKRELSLLSNGLARLCGESQAASTLSTESASLEVATDGLHSPEDRTWRGYELVDRLRMQNASASPSQVTALISLVESLNASALQEFFLYLDPISQSLWRCVDLVQQSSVWQKHLHFDLLLLHCGTAELAEPGSRNVLVQHLFSGSVGSADIRQALTLINHRLMPLAGKEECIHLLELLASIFQTAKMSIVAEEYRGLVQEYFSSDASKTFYCMVASDTARSGLNGVLSSAMDASNDDDCALVRDVASAWALSLKDGNEHATEDQIATALLWTRYLGSEGALALFDSIAEDAHSSPGRLYIVQNMLETAARALLAAPRKASSRLTILVSLRSSILQSATLGRLLASATTANVPFCIDGSLDLHRETEIKMSHATSTALTRWSQRLVTDEAEIDVDSLLGAGDLTDATVDIVTNSLYKYRKAHQAVRRWLHDKSSDECSAPCLARILHAFADSAESQEGTMEDDEPAYLKRHLKRLVTFITKRADSAFALDRRSSAVAAVASVVKRWRSLLPELQSSLRKACTAKTANDSCRHFLALGTKLVKLPGADVRDALDPIIDMGLSWAVRVSSDGASSQEEDQAAIADIGALAASTQDLKSHLVEPVLTAAVQSSLSNALVLQLAEGLVHHSHLKPASVNKFIQSIAQHPQLYTLASPSSPTTPRTALITLLHTFFHTHPTNTCQPTHVEPLRPLYGGTLSRADLHLLQIFQLYESTRRASVGALFSTWSAAPEVASGGALDALLSLEPARVFKTCVAFPDRRQLFEHAYESGDGEFDSQLYDPVFVMLLFAQMVSEGAPESALVWVQLFRTNIICLFIRALSARDDALREMAAAQLAALYRMLQDADMQEKPHILHILNLLKDLLPKLSSPSATAPARVPAYTTLLLAHALRGVLHPAHFTYPLTARFLLQRPALDAGDVPLLFSMLYAAGDAWRRERAWVVRFLADGMCGGTEWRVLKRRHAWELVASLFSGEERDLALRRGILEFLASITCNAHATAVLVFKGALLAWIEMQLQHRNVRGNEPLAWVRILENIVAVLEPSKAEAVTDGEWRAIISRCLVGLLRDYGSTESIYQATVPLLLRLSLLPGGPTQHIHDLLALCLPWLCTIESTLSLSASLSPSTSKPPFPSAPYTAHAIFRAPPSMDLRTWGESVEALWRVSMVITEKGNAWDELSARVLVWRALVGEESAVGEWVREEVVKSIART